MDTFIDPVFGESQDVPNAPAPRWTLAPGRWLCYDGKLLVTLSLYEEKGTGRRNCNPVEADDLAHLLVALLEGWTDGREADFDEPRGFLFPVDSDLASDVRAVTPTTLPTA